MKPTSRMKPMTENMKHDHKSTHSIDNISLNIEILNLMMQLKLDMFRSLLLLNPIDSIGVYLLASFLFMIFFDLYDFPFATGGIVERENIFPSDQVVFLSVQEKDGDLLRYSFVVLKVVLIK